MQAVRSRDVNSWHYAKHTGSELMVLVCLVHEDRLSGMVIAMNAVLHFAASIRTLAIATTCLDVRSRPFTQHALLYLPHAC